MAITVYKDGRIVFDTLQEFMASQVEPSKVEASRVEKTSEIPKEQLPTEAPTVPYMHPNPGRTNVGKVIWVVGQIIEKFNDHIPSGRAVNSRDSFSESAMTELLELIRHNRRNPIKWGLSREVLYRTIGNHTGGRGMGRTYFKWETVTFYFDLADRRYYMVNNSKKTRVKREFTILWLTEEGVEVYYNLKQVSENRS